MRRNFPKIVELLMSTIVFFILYFFKASVINRYCFYNQEKNNTRDFILQIRTCILIGNLKDTK